MLLTYINYVIYFIYSPRQFLFTQDRPDKPKDWIPMIQRIQGNCLKIAVQDLLKAQGSVAWDFKYVTATIIRITELLQNAVPGKAKNLVMILHG